MLPFPILDSVLQFRVVWEFVRYSSKDEIAELNKILEVIFHFERIILTKIGSTVS